MQYLIKDYSGVPNIKTVKIREEEYRQFNTFAYPSEEEYVVGRGTYGTCDSRLDAIELPL